MFSSRLDQVLGETARNFSQTVLPLDSTRRAPFRTAGVVLRYARTAQNIRNAIAHYSNRASPRRDLEGMKVVLFAYQEHWMETVVATAIALASRGAKPTIAWLPYFSDVPFQPSLTKGLTRFIRGAFNFALSGADWISGLDLHSLSPETASSDAIEAMEKTSRFDTHYLTRRETLSLDESSSEASLQAFRFKRDLAAYSLAMRAFARRSFDSAIIPNGSIFEFAAFARASRDSSVPFSTFEFWERHGISALNLDRHFFDGFETTYWSKTPKILTAPIRDRVARSMAAREGTEWKDHVIRYQTAEAGTAADLRRELRLDETKPTILILPNVPYDTSILGTPGPFGSMGEWLVSTLDALAPRTDCNVVIRAHPAESVLDARETAAEIVRGRFDQLPAHFRFIASDARINTYSLMRITNLGVVYSSTTGLELAMRRIPTLVATKIHYAEKGFTLQVENRSDIGSLIDRVLRDPKPLDQHATDLAWLYADMYMNRWPRPFPFRLQKPFWPDALRALDTFWNDTASNSLQDTLTILAGGPRAYALVEKLASDPMLAPTIE